MTHEDKPLVGEEPEALVPFRGPVAPADIEVPLPESLFDWGALAGYEESPQNLEDIPNYNKLTGFEKSVMDFLPGFAESNVGKALVKFAEGPFGKLLSVLDIAAEGVERLTGFGSQWLNAAGNGTLDEFNSEIGAAWAASSLTADMVEIPKLVNGRWQYTGDLPGIDGLVKARQQIAAGMSLEDVRSEYYNGLGALAIRGQLQDAVFHIFADPINFVFPFIKPVERLQSARKLLLSTKALPEHVVAHIDELTDVLKIAEKAGDVKKIAEVKKSIKIAEGISELSWAEQKLLALTGGIPGVGTGGKLSEKILGSRINPFSLTPQARAHEYITIIANNFSSYVLARGTTPEEWIRIIERGADGLLDPRMGHMIITPEGRQVKGVMEMLVVDAKQLNNTWNLTAEWERPLLNMVAETLGENPTRIMNQIASGEELGVFQRFITKLDELPDQATKFDELLAIRGLTRETFQAGELGKLHGILKDAPYTNELFELFMMEKIADTAARHGITQFGVKARGILQSSAAAVKSAENLAFLRMNPGYPIRNWINNTGTMIARGSYGHATTKQIEKFYEQVLGFLPARARSGVGPAGIVVDATKATEASIAAEKALQKGQGLLAKTVTGKKGWVDNIADRISGISLGKWDTGQWASRIESRASQRALAVGYQRAWKDMFWKPSKGFDTLADYSSDLASDVGDNVARTLENAIGDSWNEAQLAEKIFKADNINLNATNIVSRAERELGYELSDVLPREMIESLGDDLVEAAKTGKIDDFLATAKAQVNRHMEEWYDESLRGLAEQTAALVEAEGPGAFTKLWGDVVDDMHGTMDRHAIDTSRIVESIKQGTDPKLANAQWRAMLEHNSAYYGRFWNRQEARFKGLATAAKKADLPGADNVLNEFKAIRREWKNFFNRRNSLWSTYHDAKVAGKLPPKSSEEIVRILNSTYGDAIRLEDDATRAIDSILADMLPESQRGLYRVWREEIADLRLADKESVQKFRRDYGLTEGTGDLSLEERFRIHWQDRMKRWAEIKLREKDGLVALEGNEMAESTFLKVDLDRAKAAKEAEKAVGGEEELARLKELGAEARAGRVGEEVAELPESLVSEINKLFDTIDEGGIPAFMTSNLRRILQEAGIEPTGDISKLLNQLRAKVGREAVEGAAKAAPVQGTGLTDFHSIVPREQFVAFGLDDLQFTRGNDALNALGDAARQIADEKPLKFAGMSEDVQKQVRGYIKTVEGQMADTRYASMRFGEYTRDSALLNYSRRMNYNTWLGTVAPYEFWATQTMFKWALHSIDRPAVLTNFLRAKKFLETGFRPESGFPSRLKGHIRINAPFLSKIFGEWIGEDIFVNPLDVAIPIDNFLYGYEEYEKQQLGDIGMTERTLEELVNDGHISEAEYEDAINNRQGPVWERAMALAQKDDSEARLNMFDFAAMTVRPHAPLMWAYLKAQGREEEIGPFLPITRTVKGITAMFGINEGKGVNLEGSIRNALGLPEFSQWDDYRVERMMVNMLATQETLEGVTVTSDMVKRAMLEQEGPLWDEAQRRAGIEFGIGAMGSSLGVPAKAYPPGEEIVREKREAYEAAWTMYEQGDLKAYGRFIDENPDYEARLSLFKSPEERMQTFLVDQLWDKWNNLSSLDKREMKDQLGVLFSEAFLSKDTRSYDSVPPEQLAVWLKLMGGDPPGTLGGDVQPLELLPPEISSVAQFFYDTRNSTFPNWFELQNAYYDLPKGAQRTKFKNENPELVSYWKWRWDFLGRNPEAALYLSDNPPDPLPGADRPELKLPEINSTIFKFGGSALVREVGAWRTSGQMSEITREMLKELAGQMGITLNNLLDLLSLSQ